MNGFVVRASLAAALALSGMPLRAESASEGDEWIRARAVAAMQSHKMIGGVREELWRIYKLLELSGPGVSRRDFELIEQSKRAKHLSNEAQRYLQYDLDSDQRVTAAEIRQARTSEMRGLLAFSTSPRVERADHILDTLMAADANKDGSVTLEEIYAAADKQPHYRADRDFPPLSLDANRDGVIDEKEYLAAVDRVLAGFDPKHTGFVDPAALEAGVKLIQERENRKRDSDQREAEWRRLEEVARGKIKTCAFPAIPKGTDLILVGSGGADRVATVSLGGSERTSLTDVEIEPGAKPLYLVATSSGAMIWRLRGAVERVERLVVSGYDRREAEQYVGIVGLPKDKIFFAPHGCISHIGLINDYDFPRLSEEEKKADKFAWSKQAKAWNARLFEIYTGVKAALVVDADNREGMDEKSDGVYLSGVTEFKLPSGARLFKKAPAAQRPSGREGAAEVLAWNENRLDPNAPVDIDPASVTSPVEVKRQGEAASYVKLIRDGAIEPIGWIHGFVDEDGTVSITGSHKEKAGQRGYLRIPFAFRVKKPFAFPSDTAIYSMADPAFFVSEGVAFPTGAAGGACVAREPANISGTDGYELRNLCQRLRPQKGP